MTAQYTKIGNSVGWFNFTTNTWEEDPAIEIYLPDCIGNLSYAMQDELGQYFLKKPIVKEFLSTGRLTAKNIESARLRLNEDFAASVISEPLKDAILAALENLRSRF